MTDIDPRSEFEKRVESVARTLYVTRGSMLREVAKLAPQEQAIKHSTKDVHISMDTLCSQLARLCNFVDSSKTVTEWEQMFLDIGKKIAEERERSRGQRDQAASGPA